jgi:MFS family permease
VAGSGEGRRSVTLRDNLAPFRHRNYTLYWLGLWSSNAGRWAEQTGSVWLIYLLTDSPILLGLLGVAKALPTIFIGPLAGVVADRLDQRRLLFATQGLALLASLSLGVLVVTGTVQLWHIYLEILLTSVISAFDISARQALFPRLVPRAQLPAAVTLSALAGRSSAVVGPAVGGLAIASLGVGAPYLINAATFLVLMGALVAMRNVPHLAPGLRTSFVGELRDGLRYIRTSSVLSGLLRLEIVFGGFQVNPVITAIIAREVLHVGPEGLGGLLSAPAVGAVAGLGFLLVFGHTRRPGRFIVYCQLIYAGAMVLFALSGSYVISLLLLATTGVFDILETVTRLSISQLAAPPQMRGRVMSNMRTVTGGIGPMSQTQSGFVAGFLGGPGALLLAAAALATSAATTVRTNQALWRFTSAEAAAEPDVIGAEEDVSGELSATRPGP